MHLLAKLKLLCKAMWRLIFFTLFVINILLPILTYMSSFSTDFQEQINTFCALTQTILPLATVLPIAYIAKFAYDPGLYEVLFSIDPLWQLKAMSMIHLAFLVNIFIVFVFMNQFIPGAILFYLKIFSLLTFLFAVVSLLMAATHSFTLTIMLNTLYVLANFLFFRVVPKFPMYYETFLRNEIALVMRINFPYLAFAISCLFAASRLNRKFIAR